MSDRLTVKQSKWLDIYMETGNATEAAMQVYDVSGRGSAGQIGHENLKKLDGHIKKVMEARGLGLGRIMDKLNEGLDAKKIISATIIEGKQREADSQTNDFIEVPDYEVRHKYLETASNWYGIQHELHNERQHERPNQQLNVFVGDDEGQLAQRLAGLFGGFEQRSNPPENSEA